MCWRVSCVSLRRVKPWEIVVCVCGLDFEVEAQALRPLISSLISEIRGWDLHGRLMDLMWWDMCGFGADGRFGFLFGNERERRKTPTMFLFEFNEWISKWGKECRDKFLVFWRPWRYFVQVFIWRISYVCNKIMIIHQLKILMYVILQ